MPGWVIGEVVGPAAPQDPHPTGAEAAQATVVSLAAVIAGLAEGVSCPEDSLSELNAYQTHTRADHPFGRHYRLFARLLPEC
jgi:hypothetical protein